MASNSPTDFKVCNVTAKAFDYLALPANWDPNVAQDVITEKIRTNILKDQLKPFQPYQKQPSPQGVVRYVRDIDNGDTCCFAVKYVLFTGEATRNDELFIPSERILNAMRLKRQVDAGKPKARAP